MDDLCILRTSGRRQLAFDRVAAVPAERGTVTRTLKHLFGAAGWRVRVPPLIPRLSIDRPGRSDDFSPSLEMSQSLGSPDRSYRCEYSDRCLWQ